MVFKMLRMVQIWAVILFLTLVVLRPELLSWKDALGMTCFLTYLAGHSGKVRIPRLVMLVAIVFLACWQWSLFIDNLPKTIAALNLPNQAMMLMGCTANVLVVLVNGGYMPIDLHALDKVTPKFIVDPKRFRFRCALYKLADHTTRLHFLCDRLVGLPLMPSNAILSVGDVLIMYGLLYLFATGFLSMLYAMLVAG